LGPFRIASGEREFFASASPLRAISLSFVVIEISHASVTYQIIIGDDYAIGFAGVGEQTIPV